MTVTGVRVNDSQQCNEEKFSRVEQDGVYVFLTCVQWPAAE